LRKETLTTTLLSPTIFTVRAMNMSKVYIAAAAMFCVIIFFGLVLVPLANADWSMYRSDPSRTGAGTGSPVLTPNLLWKTNIPSTSVKVGNQTFESGRTFTTPVVVHGIIYVCSTSSVINGGFTYLQWLDAYAFNATNGAKIWDHKINFALLSMLYVSAPAVTDDMVYFGAGNGLVYALNAKNGNLEWSTNVNTIGQSSPVIVDRILYISGGNGFVYALNAANGEIMWKHQAGDNTAWSSPAVINGTLYIGSYDDNFYALSATTGKELWAYKTNDWIQNGPSVDNGVVYVPSRDGSVYALNATTGDRIWKFDTTPSDYVYQEQEGDPALPFSPAIDNGTIYITSELFIQNSNHGWTLVYALNALTGVKVWNYTITASDNYISPPIVVDGIIYLRCAFGLLALDAKNGAVVWSDDSEGYSSPSDPIVDNGVLFIGTGDGQICALGSTPPIYPPYNPALPHFRLASTEIIIALTVFVICAITVIILRRLRTLKNPKSLMNN
jgi:outer membrane protein assembly factor BamB